MSTDEIDVASPPPLSPRPNLAAFTLLNLVAPGVGLLLAGRARLAALFFIGHVIYVPAMFLAVLYLPWPVGHAAVIMALALLPVIVSGTLSWRAGKRAYAQTPATWKRRWQTVAVALVAMPLLIFGDVMLFREYGGNAVVVPNGGMTPTVLPGDRVFVNRLDHHLGRAYRVGDVVTFKSPKDPAIIYMQRIAALGGQTIEVRDHRAIVDGVPAVEPFADTESDAIGPSNFGPLRVPDGMVFLLGDRRWSSADSRYNGLSKVTDITGRAAVIYFSSVPKPLYAPRPRFSSQTPEPPPEPVGTLRWSRFGTRIE